MRIGIDARFYGADSKGLGRYVQKLIENLEKIYLRKKNDDRDQFFVFLKSETYNKYCPKNKNFHKVLADYKWYGFSEQIKFPILLSKYKLDLVHFPNFIVTIHDLILLHFPTTRGTTLNPFLYRLKFLAYKIIIKNAIKKSKKIITVSKFTKKDILKNYPLINSDKIYITYESCDKNKLKVKKNDVLSKYGIIKPYILYVGNAYPHKNLEGLVSAWNVFKKKDNQEFKLVLVGKEDYFYKRLKRFVKEKGIENVIFSGFVSDVDLYDIYKNSEAYIFPSLYEGFGLPPLEAMQNGIPVISSNHQCMKEILEGAAHYFNAKDNDSIVQAIEKITTDEKMRNTLIKRGYLQVKKYSWEEMAKKTLEIYKNGYHQNKRKIK